MEKLQLWTMRHQLAFVVGLAGVAIVLGWAVNADVFFWVSASLSGIGWLSLAGERFPELERKRSRRRGARFRRTARASLLPPLSLPEVPHVLLPLGQKIQVTKEEGHLDGLGELLTERGERHMAATLHRLPPASPRSVRERVQVRIDGTPVGELTLYMSEHFLPLITVCEDRGIAVVCRALVKGNQLKADVVLNTVKAIDLGDDWIDEHVLGGGTPS